MSVHMEREYWRDPDQFRPERHLNPEGQLIKSDHIINFGMGIRKFYASLTKYVLEY